MTDIIKIFGRRLQQLRKMRKLTQAQFAELVGLEVSTISRIEKGSQFPKAENINKFVKALNVDIKDFYEYPFEMNKEELLESIQSILNKATHRDLQYYNKMMQLHLQYKSYHRPQNKYS